MISFCIPAHNEERLLPATLAAIHESAREAGLEYEIVVADDASTDGTPGVALGAGARVVTIDRRQISAARNAAARTAVGDPLFFIDADTVIHAEAVRQALALLGAGCVAGGATIRFDGRVPLWATALLESLLVPYRIARLSSGAFMFCTREAYRKSGGYDETLFGGEEVYFAVALKRVGRFRLIKDRVTTSGRKLRAHSCGEIMSALLRAGFKGRRGVMSREGLDLWYGPRREDVESGRTATQQSSK